MFDFLSRVKPRFSVPNQSCVYHPDQIKSTTDSCLSLSTCRAKVSLHVNRQQISVYLHYMEYFTINDVDIWIYRAKKRTVLSEFLNNISLVEIKRQCHRDGIDCCQITQHLSLLLVWLMKGQA